MDARRERLIVSAVGIVFAAALSSCGAPASTPPVQAASTPDVAAVRDLASAPDLTEPLPVEASGASCFHQQGGVWQPAYEKREATCFARDNCSGGAGREAETPTCLKWALGPDEPALPWSRSLTEPQLAEDVPPPQEIYEGSYEMTSDCHAKGCAFGSARFTSATALRAIADARSPVIGTIPPGECVDTESDSLMEAPRRGVVLEDQGRFAAGDVIYFTGSEGEGFSTIWRRGEYLQQYWDEEAVVRWEDGPDHPLAGYWVKIKRANGLTGWVRNPDANERDCNPERG
ncbi:MAG: hypothetical protein RIR33_1973 [Pseudomonadota bacterium]|jgi:hypothetical protein